MRRKKIFIMGSLRTIYEEKSAEFLEPAPLDSSSEESENDNFQGFAPQTKIKEEVIECGSFFSSLIGAFAFAVRHQSGSGRSA